MTDQLRYEEAEQNKKDAQKNEQKMQERIGELTNKCNASKQQLNGLNKKAEDLANGKNQIENALRKCEEIRKKEFPAVLSSVTEVSAECSITFESSLGELGILNVYEEDLNQTQKELDDISQELTERLAQVNQQKMVMNADIAKIKKEITEYENEMATCKKKESAYAQQVLEYTARMKRYQ